MAQYMLSHLETAACLWEAILELRDRPATDSDAIARALAMRKSFDALGTSALRYVVVNWVDALEAAWAASECDYPLSFDWDFVPRWIVETIDWSDPRNPAIRETPPASNAVEEVPTLSDPVGSTPACASYHDHLALLARARAALETPDDLDTAALAALIEDIGVCEDALSLSSLPWPIDIHAAAIEHRHGTNLHVAVDGASLDAEIAAFCREWWSEIGDERDSEGLDDGEVIAAYFDQHPSESYIKDRVRLVPASHPRTVVAETIEQGRYCVLSTAHLTVQTARLLDEWAAWPPTERPIDIAASVYGWFVPTRLPGQAQQARLPDDLLKLMAFGRERAFRFLLLDCDGDSADALPVHDW